PPSPARARGMAVGDSRSADRPAIVRVGGGSGTTKVRIMRRRLPLLALLKADLDGGHRRTRLPVVQGRSTTARVSRAPVTNADGPPTTHGNTAPTEPRLPPR